MTITVAIPALFLIASWVWAGYFREINASLLALWAIATFFIAPLIFN
jgi:hypothetical protein